MHRLKAPIAAAVFFIAMVGGVITEALDEMPDCPLGTSAPLFLVPTGLSLLRPQLLYLYFCHLAPSPVA